MDSSSRRPQLPALSYLDVDKLKKEEDAFQDRNSFGTPKNGTAPSTSPPYNHASGPPAPAYAPAAPYHTNSWPAPTCGTHTPPASRRTSAEDHENGAQPVRRSLPSISEAIGPLDNTPSHAHPAPTSQAPPPPVQLPPQSTAPRSPLSSTRRSFPMEPPPSSGQYSYYRQDSAGPNTFTSPDLVKPAYGSHSDVRHQINGQTAQPAVSASYAPPLHASPRCESRSTAPNTSMPPPPPSSSSFAYGYASTYPPRQTQTTSNGSAGPIYQPSTQYSAPSSTTSSWKSQSTGPSRYPDERPAYGESVKRHLEMYDLEASLAEITSKSSIVTDFSRRYGDRTHQAARTGLNYSSLPTISEIDDMITKSHHITDNLMRIRDLVMAQQAAYEQQLADQQQQQTQQQRSKVQFASDPSPPSAPPSHHLPTDIHHAATNGGADPDDMKGGFANGETKKRRGRAAPPGRCHSCQRAETPEWRRGPDGARTLCNACGLHYAKLTRKQGSGGAGKTGGGGGGGGGGVPVGSAGGGALRPKEV